MKRFVFSFLTLVCLAQPLQSETQGTRLSAEDQARISAMDKRLIKQIQRDPARYLQNVLTQLYSVAPDGAVTEQLMQKQLEAKVAQQREMLKGQFFRFDLNDDEIIDAEEIIVQLGTLSPREKAALQTFVQIYDKNRDGSLSAAEGQAFVDHNMKNMQLHGRNAMEMLKPYDLNSDGTITAQEVMGTIELALKQSAAAKKPGAAKQTKPKRPNPAKQRIKAKRQALAGAGLPEACAYPAKSEAAVVHRFSADQGAALSTVAVTGQDAVTTAGMLHIEAGAEPIYLVMGALEPTVWTFEGATDRIERVVLPRSNAVTGLPPEKVHFVHTIGCAPGAGGARGRQINEVLSDVLLVSFGINRAPVTHSRHSVEHILWPSGEEMLTPERLKRMHKGEPAFPVGRPYRNPVKDIEGLIASLRGSSARQFPAGVRALDAKTVVSAGAAEPYALLPQYHGLIQMVEEGLLWGTAGGAVIIGAPLERLPIWGEGQRSPELYLDHDVSFDPTRGNLQDYTVLHLVTGKCLYGPGC